MNSSFKRNLLIGFGLSLLLLIISSVASYNSIQNLLQSASLVDHTNSVIQKLEGVMSMMKDAETGQRGYLLTEDETFLDPYYGAADSALSQLREVEVLTKDNELQQASVKALGVVINQRLSMLKSLADLKRNRQAINADSLRIGKYHMDEIRGIVKQMSERERTLLRERTEELNEVSGFTPVLIIITALLSLIITSVFYMRVKTDFDDRSRLHMALQQKDADISRRIGIIQEIAGQISSGDYAVRAKDEGSDGLGNLAYAINRMANSLETSFTQLSENEWLQTGMAGLNDKMVGEKEKDTLAGYILDYVATYTNSQVGALYLAESEKLLRLYSSYALSSKDRKEFLASGEGLAGQCMQSGRMILLKDIPADAMMISYAAGEIKPVNIIALPILYEQRIVAVIELASIHEYSKHEVAFLSNVAHNIGIAITSAESRRRLQELLEETQAQSEELQTQHGELENLNMELEAQTQKLQVSEEELKVQQEELMQSNAELEERSRLLEEKNQIIINRNLEIQQKAEELEISTKYKSEFLANMSHELRTPLNSILLLSRLMSENNDKNLLPDQIEYAQVIFSSGKGLLTLVDEILDLSKIEAGKMELEFQHVHLSSVISNLQSMFEPMAKDKGLELKIGTASGLPATIETDHLRLEQVLKNLLSNALKFTSAGSVSLLVDMAAGKQAVTFKVKDTGIGISEDKQQVIFEAFQQADGSTRRKYGGTGLGLSISRELVKLLGGSLALHSVPGEGSEFIVTVPLAPAEKEEQPVVTPPPRPKTSFNTQYTETPKPQYTTDVIPQAISDDRDDVRPGDRVILIVEDDTHFAKALLNFTRSRGYRGVVSVRGDEALPLALQFKPIGILLDIMLPVKDGWQVMEELKQEPRTKSIPVHIMSSMEVKRESLMKGAIDFISKPVAAEGMQVIFEKMEFVLNRSAKKVLIVEENSKHAKALSYFLGTYNVSSEIGDSVQKSIELLKQQDVDCVILDMGIPDQAAYATLEAVKETEGMEKLPIIIFTGKSLSKTEEQRIRQYADSIVVKTAHSYQRILDEVSLFLHLVEENGKLPEDAGQKVSVLNEVLKDKVVLVADDDVRNIFSLTKALEKHNMNVISATDGKEALEQLKEGPVPDIVLMDMMMPEMDGYETIAKMRQDPRFMNLPIIAVTAKAMMGDREKCIQAGASDYISKPVDIDQLLSLLRVWLYDRAFR
ncbi:response regulator [Chitinophaga horti]|uniref:histidine kinase n=1 Tax=Chitinophaga horti TaxID=2920382 RepID=A0ABY6J4R4_9BACT|nr:response regulator [Chitinophaga horti]UYQ93174.1 response regulator [Chitinophaga horti]